MRSRFSGEEREREDERDREINFMIPWGEALQTCSIVDMHVSFRIYMGKRKCVHTAMAVHVRNGELNSAQLRLYHIKL